MDSQTSRREFVVSWRQLHRDACALAWRLADIGSFKGLIAITRGGLIPTAIVARELNIRLIETICVSSYNEGRQQGAIKTLKQPEVAGKGEGWVVVDDLVDTGDTVRLVRQKLPKAHFATVYAKPAGRSMTDNFVTEVSQDTWIVFPWDNEPG